MKKIICLVLTVLLVLILLTSCNVAAINAQSSGTSSSTASSATASEASTSSSWTSWIFIIVLIVVFVVLIIVPNKRRDKKYKEMLSSIKVGSNVKTIGGVYGKVISIKEDLVTIETGPEKAKIVFTKSAIATIDACDVEAQEGSKGIEKK